jgi:hypothetical protein
MNEADNGGRTPMYMASQKGHLEVVQALVAAEAPKDYYRIIFV